MGQFLKESPTHSGDAASKSKHNRSIKHKIQDGNRKRKRKQCCPVRRLLYTLSEKTRKGASKLTEVASAKAKSSCMWLKKLKPDVLKKEVWIMLLLIAAILVIGNCGSVKSGLNKDIMDGRVEQPLLHHDIQDNDADSTWPPFPVWQFIGQLLLGFGGKTSHEVTQEEETYNTESLEKRDREADEPEVKENVAYDTNPDVTLACDESTCAVIHVGNQDDPSGAVDMKISDGDTRERDDFMEPAVDRVTEAEYSENNCIAKLCDRNIDEESEVKLGPASSYKPLLGGISSDMEDREDGSECFKAVQVSDSTSSVAENVGRQGVEACEDVLKILWTHLEKADASNQYECERLLRCVLGPGRLVIKEHISYGFKMCNPAKEVMYLSTQNTQTGEGACYVVQPQHGEESDVCLIEDKLLHDYMNIVDKGTYKTLPVFNSSCIVLETARTHQFCFSELGSNQELVHGVIKLNSSANGTVPSVSESSLERCQQNLSVQLVSTSIVTTCTPSGGQETPRKQPQQCNSKKKGAKYRAEPTQCVVGGAVGGTGGGAGGDDDGEDDERRRKKVPDDKLVFLHKKFHRRSLRLQVRLKEARRILIAFGCHYCHYSPQDNNRLCILLGASICADEVVICTQKDCPAKDFTHEDVRFIYVCVKEPLLDLFNIVRQDLTDEDLENLEMAIEEVKKCFECQICRDNYIYINVPLVMCNNAHSMCLHCRERLETALCPFCKEILPERTTTRWPRCLYEALNGRNMPDSTPSSSEDGMKQVGPPPEMTYVPPFEYDFGDSNEPEAQMYGDRVHAPRTVHPQRLYSALDVDTLGEIHEAQDLLAEEPNDSPIPPPSTRPDVISGLEDNQVDPNAPEEWLYQRYANSQQHLDVPLDDDQVVPNAPGESQTNRQVGNFGQNLDLNLGVTEELAPHRLDRTVFQRQLENYRQTHNVAAGGHAQLLANDRTMVQRRYERFLQNVVGLGSDYLSHEEFSEVVVSQNANQAAGVSASAHQEEEANDLEVDGVGDTEEQSDHDEEPVQVQVDAADGAGLGTNEAAGGTQANLVQNTNDAVTKAKQNVPVAKRRGDDDDDDDDSGRDTGSQPSRTQTPRQHLLN